MALKLYDFDQTVNRIEKEEKRGGEKSELLKAILRQSSRHTEPEGKYRRKKRSDSSHRGMRDMGLGLLMLGSKSVYERSFTIHFIDL